MTSTAPRPTESLFALAGEAMSLQQQIASLAEDLHLDDGALNPGIAETLEALLLDEAGNREALRRKADAYCWVIGNLRAQAAYRRAESDRLRDLAELDARRADALQERLITALAACDPEETRWSLPTHELTSRRTESVVIDPDLDLGDLQHLQPSLVRVKRSLQPDRAAIKAALKAGQAVPGAELVQGRSWTIR